MSEAAARVTESLAAAAETEPDLYGVAFTRYFELCPESRELLLHTDELMRGRMMEQVMSLLMDGDPEALDTYFRFEVGNHEGYGATPPMYRHLFQACRDTTEKYSGGLWNADMEAAWDAQVGLLLRLIDRYASS